MARDRGESLSPSRGQPRIPGWALLVYGFDYGEPKSIENAVHPLRVVTTQTTLVGSQQDVGVKLLQSERKGR